MNAGSPVESRYVQPPATAARTAGPPHLTNGPTVETSTSSAPTSSNRLFWRIASARATSSPPSRSASAASRASVGGGQPGPRPRRDQPLRDEAPRVARGAEDDDPPCHDRGH